ncbi:MAG: hypothetical protein SVK08_00300 [Halobacteriota archaeon]|nr:hypothetical protein [Halobacteriota archaeon]
MSILRSTDMISVDISTRAFLFRCKIFRSWYLYRLSRRFNKGLYSILNSMRGELTFFFHPSEERNLNFIFNESSVYIRSPLVEKERIVTPKRATDGVDVLIILSSWLFLSYLGGQILSREEFINEATQCKGDFRAKLLYGILSLQQ